MGSSFTLRLKCRARSVVITQRFGWLAVVMVLQAVNVIAADIPAALPYQPATSVLTNTVSDGVKTDVAAPLIPPGKPLDALADTTKIKQQTGAPASADASAINNQTIVKMAPLDTGAALFKTFGGLGIILLLIFGCAQAVKWIGKPLGSQQPLLQLVAVLPLGTKEKLALVEVGGKQILIGITPTHINPLMELAEPIAALKGGHHTNLSEKIALSAQAVFSAGKAALDEKLVLGKQGKIPSDDSTTSSVDQTKSVGGNDTTSLSEINTNTMIGTDTNAVSGSDTNALSEINKTATHPKTPLSAKTASEFSKKLNEFLKTGNRNP